MGHLVHRPLDNNGRRQRVRPEDLLEPIAFLGGESHCQGKVSCTRTKTQSAHAEPGVQHHMTNTDISTLNELFLGAYLSGHRQALVINLPTSSDKVNWRQEM